MTKWLGNCTNVLDKVPPADRSKTFLNLGLGSEPVDRVLEVRWNFIKDDFEVCVRLKEKPFTRRGVLSTVSSLYDPLGFIAPVILCAKFFCRNCVEESSVGTNCFAEKTSEFGLPGYKNCPCWRVSPFPDAFWLRA